MKKINKILAVLLVISMLAGVMAVSVSAANTTDAAFKFAFKDTSGNVINSVKAGDVVDLFVSIKTEGYSPVFQIVFCYDYTLLTHIRQNGTAAQSITANNCRELLGDFADKTTQIEDENDPIWQFERDEIGNGYYKLWGAGTSTATPHKDTMYPSSWGDAEKAQYKCISFGYMTDTSDSVLTVNTNGEFYEMVRFRFLALADTSLDSNVVFRNPDAAKSYIAIDPDDAPISCAQYSTAVKVAKIAYEYETAAVEDKIVYHVKDQIQWANKDANTVNLGVVAGFDVEDIAIEFNEAGTSTNVDKVGAVVKIGEKEDTKYERFVYEMNDGKSYYFRVVVENVPANYTGDIVVTPLVWMTGADEPIYGDPVTIDAATLAQMLTRLP